jgi:hypothetical protein
LTMNSSWPPSPQVEDEETTLKKEIAYKLDGYDAHKREEASCRGTIDQYPIILDTNYKVGVKSKHISSTDNYGDSPKGQSSDDSCGPPTPVSLKSRGNHFPSSSNHRDFRPRVEKPTTPAIVTEDANQNFTRRGRPDVPQVQTGLGDDLQGMITGQRRAPSPYSFTKPEAPQKSRESDQSSGSTFLSPDRIVHASTFPTGEKKARSSSARPRSRTRPSRDTDESSGTESRRRHRSRRPSRRRKHSKARSAAHHSPRESSTEGEKTYRYSHSGRIRAAHSRNGSDAVTSSQHDVDRRSDKRHSKESPHHSSAEESWIQRHSDFVSRSNKRYSKDSTHDSSADEDWAARRDKMRLNVPDERATRPRSGSRKERPRLDLSSHQHSYHGGPSEERHSSGQGGRTSLGPSSHRSPKAMEDYLEKALRDPDRGRHRGPASSTFPESFHVSPPASGPPTPQADGRSKEYFQARQHGSSHVADSVRSDGPSDREGSYGQVKPIAAVLAASAVAGIVPSLSRSSTSSTSVHGKSVPTRQTSGRRSRNPSPVRQEATSHSRHAHEHDDDNSQSARGDDRSGSRPVSGSGSFSYTSPRSLRPDCLSARNGTLAASAAERPRLDKRAASCCGSEMPQRPRQSSSARATQLQFGQSLNPGQDSLLPNLARLPQSPSLTETSPWHYQVAELPPCPRSMLMVGYCDWYTIVGLPQVDICPSCMTVLGASWFRDSFVPSPRKVPGQQVMCDFSRKWVRGAWLQIVRQRRSSLDMIFQIVRNAETTKPCPGKGTDLRAWYRLPDPKTGSNVPNFDACSECVRSIEIVFPQLRAVFTRSSALVQERTCDLTTRSRRFDSYLKLLDAAATQYDVERLREPDLQAFAEYARKTARVRECSRDDMVMGQVWHFIPALPEFTMCEECFEEVVWPVADQPVARCVKRSLSHVPGVSHSTGLSCQLYSERMRKAFHEAVKYQDFEFLREVAQRRYGAERMLQEKHRALMNDVAIGIPRTAELQANIEDWRRWE